jgi:hypothetical protein
MALITCGDCDRAPLGVCLVLILAFAYFLPSREHQQANQSGQTAESAHAQPSDKSEPSPQVELRAQFSAAQAVRARVNADTLGTSLGLVKTAASLVAEGYSPEVAQQLVEAVQEARNDPKKLRVLECLGADVYEAHPEGWRPPSKSECRALIYGV